MRLTDPNGTIYLDDDAIPTEADMNDIISSLTDDDDNGAKFQRLCDASTGFPDGLTCSGFKSACEKWLAENK